MNKKKTIKKKLIKKPAVKTPAKILKTRIAIVLDASSSMTNLRAEVIQGVNAQLTSIRKNNKKNMDTTISLLSFSDSVHPYIYNNVSIDEVKDLTIEDYCPNGMTALYDAMGTAMTTLGALPEINDVDTSVLLFVVTDGQENCSKKFNFSQITEKVKELERTKRWTITYLGAENGLQDVGSGMGLQLGNTLSGGVLRTQGVYSAVAGVSMDSFMTNRSVGQAATNEFYSNIDMTAIAKQQEKTKDKV